MGRRQRRRTTTDASPTPPRPASRIARVHVDDATWAEFRAVIGDRSVAEVLGRYVQTEVARAHADRMRQDDVTDREVLEVLQRAEALTATLELLTSRLMSLRRRASFES